MEYQVKESIPAIKCRDLELSFGKKEESWKGEEITFRIYHDQRSTEYWPLKIQYF